MRLFADDFVIAEWQQWCMYACTHVHMDICIHTYAYGAGSGARSWQFHTSLISATNEIPFLPFYSEPLNGSTCRLNFSHRDFQSRKSSSPDVAALPNELVKCSIYFYFQHRFPRIMETFLCSCLSAAYRCITFTIVGFSRFPFPSSFYCR